MKRAERGQGAGYTILETLIFLAVTAAMFVSAMAFISGRQNRVEFASAVRDFEAGMNDIANDVSSGYYANVTSDGRRVNCSVSGNSIAIGSSSTDSQGSNKGCIFIGRALQFRSTNHGDERYATISLVGKQYKNGLIANGDSESYADSGVKAIAAGEGDSTPNAVDVIRVGGGVTVGCVLYAENAAPATYSCGAPNGMRAIDTVAFMTKFNAASLEEDSVTGSSAVNLVVSATQVPVTTHRSQEEAVRSLNRYTDAQGTTNIVTNPTGGVHICLQSNGSNQHAWVVLGGKNSRFSASAQIVGGGC